MNSSWLEQLRFSLEGIEALERAIVKQMMLKMENPKQSVIIDNKISIFIKMIQQKSKEVMDQLRDEDPTKKQQMLIISGLKNLNSADKTKAPSLWKNFYQKTKELKDLHKKFVPVVELPTNTVEYFNKIVFSPPEKQPSFSLQQAKGKYVDMHILYFQYLNVFKSLQIKQDYKFGDYLWYLQNFDKFDSIPLSIKLKNHAKLKAYLLDLIKYLEQFLRKTRPLININAIINQFYSEFDEKYSKGLIPGFEKSDQQKQPVYCQDCDKMFTNEDVYVNHLHGKKHIKAAKQRSKNPQKQQGQAVAKKVFEEQHENKTRDLAMHQFLVSKFRDQLSTVLYDSANLIRKKQTRGYEEQEENNQQESESEADPDEPIYNPKNLPLGWDGKPIPYWLYKLHGLGVEYKCEICGNYSYWGRRSFEMHFQEWRHTYGMKCLRIPNTIHFKDVTTINDALALHQKLMDEAKKAQFRPEEQQEFEDTQGNIINRRTYNDMKKQGIL